MGDRSWTERAEPKASALLEIGFLLSKSFYFGDDKVMKNKIKVSLVFVGGLLVGALSTFIILGRISYLEYRDYFMMAAREQTFIASELRANRQRELQERAESNLPNIVLAIHNDSKLQKASGAPLVLREIKSFYERNSIPVPAEISGILSDVPQDH